MKNVNSDIAYDFLRRRILNGEYPPGRALMTEVLSDEIGVSRTPVRDALRKLEADGLVSIRARLGASVKKMDVKEFREMCDLRLALESHAAGLAAVNHSPADLREIEFALDAMRGLTERMISADREEALIGELVREDVRFHIAIMTAAKNDLMKKEILRLHLINRVVSGPSSAPAGSERGAAERKEKQARRRVVLASHEEIYRAIAKRDAPGAKHAMERHIQDIIDSSLRTMVRAESGLIARELTPEELSYTA